MGLRGFLGKTGCVRIFSLVAIPIFLNIQSTHAEHQVLGVRHWSAPSSTRIVLDLPGKVVFHDFLLKDPPRIVVDLQNARFTGGKVVTINDDIVQRVRMAMHSSRVLRVVVDLKSADPAHQVFLVPEIEGRPFRLVIHVDCPELGEKIVQERLTVQKEKEGKGLVVVIDPGHGGEDPGAISPRGTREKDVVLAMARTLAARLNRNPGIRAFLTRDGDYFLSLSQRVSIAQDYGADFFISIHADSSRRKSTNGASVYCLSLDGATDEAARILAEKENASDLVGGAVDSNVISILLDLVQNQTINDSSKWGGMALIELEKTHRLKFKKPRQAGFRVLRAPDIPSILVEVGFITNSEDERLMRSPAFQSQVAVALEGSICRFVYEQMQVGSDLLALSHCGTRKPLAHIVQPGQSLSQIALLYDTSIRKIQQANHLRNASRIYPGQELLIP